MSKQKTWNIGDEGYGERKLVLESARVLEGGRHIRGGVEHDGSKGCDDTDGAGECKADSHASRYAATLSDVDEEEIVAEFKHSVCSV